MELIFETSQLIAQGNNPAGVHFEDQTAQMFYTNDTGRMYGIDTVTPEGNWENREFSDPLVVAPDINISRLTLRRISRHGVYGSWHSDDRHRFAIYGVDFDVTDYIEDGSVNFAASSPISAININLNNPNKYFMSEDNSIVSPGSRILLSFMAGDSVPYHMGTTYVDRSGYAVKDSNVVLDGRNSIGKLLRDQTFDEVTSFGYKTFDSLLKDILDHAGIPASKYFIDPRAAEFSAGLSFAPNMSILDGLNEALRTVRGWKMQEHLDGSIIIGLPDFYKFDQPNRYTFYRNKDIFSRSITRDDMNSYRRVCIFCDDFATKVYKDVQIYEGWSLGNHKTFYVEVASGTSLSDCTAYAEELANMMKYVGVIESFAGPIRPHLQIGDEAEIIGEDDYTKRILGLVTDVRHRFGKSGIYTEFTVDSGGRLGKGTISEYIEKLNQRRYSSTRLYEELPPPIE